MKQPTPQKVLVTDYAWPTLALEQEILGRVGARLVEARTGSEEELVGLAPEAAGILTCWKPVTRRVIEQATGCLAIARYGIGLDNIDVPCATEHGIVVTNVPSYCRDEVAEHALSLILACARKIAAFDGSNKAGVYNLRAHAPIYRIRGKTLGIVGFGQIGRTLFQKASGLGMQTLVYDMVPVPASLERKVKAVALEELLASSDFISLHVPLLPQTRNLMRLETFRKMKPTAFLVNTCRGEVIDGAALIQALDEGLIAGAALDVYPQEPPPPDSPLLRHPKIIATPHASFYSEESLQELQETAATQMADVLRGKLPRWIVNQGVLSQSNLRASFRKRKAATRSHSSTG
jgi:D-3-phosphoglycerate dehydrogenase